MSLQPDTGVIALVPELWHGMARTTRHHVMRHLADHFQVVWVEPSIYWRQYVVIPSLLMRPQRAFDVGPRLQVLPASVTQAKVYRPQALARMFERRRLNAARALLQRRGCRRIVLYIWRAEYADALDVAHADLTCYHIDDEYTFSREDSPTPPAEAALIARSDVVFLHSRELFAKKGGLNPRSLLVPNGVDFRAFNAPVSEPADLAQIPRPRIGYAGVIKQQLDLALLLQVARRRPDWSFVLVGPIGMIGDQADSLRSLQQLPNCHFPGRKSAAELPAYVQHFDVCTLGYVMDGYTRYIYPLKLHEYLAAGRPVVATHIPALEEFRDVVYIASSADEWVASIERALAEGPTAGVTRTRIAANHDWSSLVARIANAIEQNLIAKGANQK